MTDIKVGDRVRVAADYCYTSLIGKTGTVISVPSYSGGEWGVSIDGVERDYSIERVELIAPAPTPDLDELATKVADILAARSENAESVKGPEPRPALPRPFEHEDQDGDRFKVEAYSSGGHVLSARGVGGSVLVTLHNNVIPALIAFLQAAHAANDGR